MKKCDYTRIFSSYHTLYRLITASTKLEYFVTGIGKLYRTAFKPDITVIICKYAGIPRFLKVKSQKNENIIFKKGGISILSRRERTLFEENREIVSTNRLMAPFIFDVTLGGVYLKRVRNPFTEQEQKWFISLSEQITTAFKVIHLYIEEKRVVLSYINAVSKLLNQYVPTSYIHYKSIAKLIRELGRILRLSELEIKSIEYASLLHDAGKIHLPHKILEKQEPLTEDEYRIIMKHPKEGIEIIKDLGALKPVLPIILHHHERYDGRGYPSKLKKKNIPFGSRVLAVIDAFDAMFFGRPYKNKMTLEEIEREFKKQTGIQFDPDIVTAFLKILKKKSIKKYLNLLP